MQLPRSLRMRGVAGRCGFDDPFPDSAVTLDFPTLCGREVLHSRKADWLLLRGLRGAGRVEVGPRGASDHRYLCADISPA